MSAGLPKPSAKAAFGADAAGYDEDIYGPGVSGFSRQVVEPGDDDDGPAVDLSQLRKPAAPSVTAPQQYLDEASAAAAAVAAADGSDDPFKKHRAPTIAERQSDYHARRFSRPLSPPAAAVTAAG
jgi:hypothetical protein